VIKRGRCPSHLRVTRIAVGVTAGRGELPRMNVLVALTAFARRAVERYCASELAALNAMAVRAYQGLVDASQPESSLIVIEPAEVGPGSHRVT
jgi:hypothetical protein